MEDVVFQHGADYIIDSNGCWISTHEPNGKGYITVGCNGYRVTAHRLMYSLHYGKIPSGMQINHTCDVRNCINPLHLYAGTVSDNAQDMVRGYRGHKQIQPDVVNEILTLYARGVKQSDIALMVDVSKASVSRIVRKGGW